MNTKLSNYCVSNEMEQHFIPKYYYAAPESTTLINVYILLH